MTRDELAADLSEAVARYWWRPLPCDSDVDLGAFLAAALAPKWVTQEANPEAGQ